MIQQLPSDLTDLVIDHISAEPASLSACALVCRQWFPRSRYHLFAEMKLQVGRALKRKGWYDEDKMDAFMDLMDASPTNLLATIRRLRLSYGDGQSLAKAHLLRFPSCPLLLDLSIGLPRDSDADIIEGIRFQMAVVGNKFSSLSSFAFRFHSSTIRAATVFEVVSYLPTLETLSLGGDDVTEGTAPLCILPPRLRSFDTHILRGIEFLFEHLISLPTLPLFRWMGMNNDGMELHGDTPMASYIKHAGHAVESLDLTIWGEEESFEQLALQYCTNLRHISIESNQTFPPYTYLIGLLSKTTSNDLRTIDIATHTNNMCIELADEDDVAARALDNMLADPRFRNLTRFSVSDIGDRESVFTLEVQAKMLRARARGILQDPVRATTPFQSARVTMDD
ncbi:hypothetical protein DFH07DRAFT_954132 [Mycena maculata]|uniref:F-box domain-containing protein n=1 Tax=Mycena maculata TaxID=230809 RepID=A0AAD7JTP6_9AGAR|nr:hypothetical protein DFH07DRAFT_954132 [Mycena maculata]